MLKENVHLEVWLLGLETLLRASFLSDKRRGGRHENSPVMGSLTPEERKIPQLYISAHKTIPRKVLGLGKRSLNCPSWGTALLPELSYPFFRHHELALAANQMERITNVPQRSRPPWVGDDLEHQVPHSQADLPAKESLLKKVPPLKQLQDSLV